MSLDLDTKNLLSEAKFYESYSRYNEDEDRYETWNESVERVMNMHREYYAEKMTPELSELIDFSEKLYKEKKFLGAQRALQFGGESLLKHPSRLYNCTASYVDRPDFFGEALFLLLSGCGVGFSVQQRHIDSLPAIHPRLKQSKVFTIPDSIEGWSDALAVLMSSFFEGGGTHPEYEGRKVFFEYHKIREKGAPISGGFKAPGPEPLRNALNKIENILISVAEQKRKLKSIEIYDIIMHSSDAVLAGGVRRSATLCMFDRWDDEMINAKTGNWYVTNPQRGRSNNSVVLKRDEVTKEEFDTIIERTKQFGEPGFIWIDDYDTLYNPCVSGDTILNVKDSNGNEYKLTIDELTSMYVNNIPLPMVLSRNIENGKDEYSVISVAAKTQKNAKLMRITDELTGKSIKVTENHKIWTENRGWVEAKFLKEDDVLKIK